MGWKREGEGEWKRSERDHVAKEGGVLSERVVHQREWMCRIV